MIQPGKSFWKCFGQWWTESAQGLLEAWSCTAPSCLSSPKPAFLDWALTPSLLTNASISQTPAMTGQSHGVAQKLGECLA